MNTANHAINGTDVWGRVKEIVYPVLVSSKSSRNLGKSTVSQKYLDMTVMFILRGIKHNGRTENIRVTSDMLESLGIGLEELAETAYHNLEKDGYSFMRVEDCIMYTGSDEEHDYCEEADLLPGCLYVLTNRSRFLGASGILNSEMIRNMIGDKKCYILPSSIHEILFLPDDGEIDVETLTQIVKQVNNSEVSPEEQLSDHVYYYDGNARELSVCA